jgi:hypothetical protein
MKIFNFLNSREIRPALGPTQRRVSFQGGTAAGAWSWPLTTAYCRGRKWVELHLYPPTCVHARTSETSPLVALMFSLCRVTIGAFWPRLSCALALLSAGTTASWGPVFMAVVLDTPQTLLFYFEIQLTVAAGRMSAVLAWWTQRRYISKTLLDRLLPSASVMVME